LHHLKKNIKKSIRWCKKSFSQTKKRLAAFCSKHIFSDEI